MYQDFVFDTDITIVEVAASVKPLRSGKSGGPDNLDPEHLKWWVCTSCLAFTLPLSPLKPSHPLSKMIPVYKGKGRDPLDPNSYRGIMLTSVLSTCLEKMVLQWMEIPLKTADFPHLSQTMYQLPCADAIFFTQEALLKFVREGDDASIILRRPLIQLNFQSSSHTSLNVASTRNAH